MNNKNSIFKFDPNVYKTRKSLEDYSIYNFNFIFKINKLSAVVKRYTVRNFRKYNIGNPELVILSLIGQVKDQLTIKDLTTVHWMDKGFISRASKKLIELKLIKKINFPSDRRRHYFKLTLKGKKIFNELQNIKMRRYKKLSENLTNEEIVNFNTLLDKMLQNSEKNLVK
jgi:DNA-binding MarR family transcriptional regulator|tara:strand:+ start:250 stop:759 length:510 start_codon:yes stop_codon:yes gene_type:complete